MGSIINLAMVSSLGFGSKKFNYALFFQTIAFTSPPPNGLSFAKNFKLLAHYTKGKFYRLKRQKLLVKHSDFIN
jgi:hypothetical protein